MRRKWLGLKKSGGEGGIRTLGTGVSPYNGLANRRIRPLCHLSGPWDQNFADTLPSLWLHGCSIPWAGTDASYACAATQGVSCAILHYPMGVQPA